MAATTSLPFRVEDRVDQPLSLYAATKKADELMSETYAHLYRLPQTGLRFFTVYGPWGRPDMAMWLFTEAILEGRPIEVFNDGDMRRDFTYHRRHRRRRASPASTIRRPTTVRSRPAAASAPHRALQYRQPPLRAARATDRPDRGGVRRDGDPRSISRCSPATCRDTYADISAIQRDLGFAPTTTIDDGVPRFVDWFRALSRRVTRGARSLSAAMSPCR